TRGGRGAPHFPEGVPPARRSQTAPPSSRGASAPRWRRVRSSAGLAGPAGLKGLWQVDPPPAPALAIEKPVGEALARREGRRSSAGFAGAILSWGEVRKGGGAPLRV